MSSDPFNPIFRKSAQRTGWFIVFLLLGLFLAYLSSGIYSIESSQVGVLLRFGVVADTAIPSGIHYALPWPIDRVIRVPVRTVMRLSIDDFDEKSKLAKEFVRITGLRTYLITGDNNAVTLSCVLQYSIQDPAKYLFALDDSERTLRNLACNTLVEALARVTIDDILTTGKSKIQIEVKHDLQARLDQLDSGLAITFVELQDVRPPERVQNQFNDVINAMIDKEKMINTAKSYQNEKLPQAKADADRLLRNAEAYRDNAITRAEGDADRFRSQLAEYQRAPDITRHRLHFEFLNELLPSISPKVVVGRHNNRPIARIVSPMSDSAAAGSGIDQFADTPWLDWTAIYGEDETAEME